MKILTDINIPQSIIIALTEAGHNILDLKKIQLNLKDTEIIRLAKNEKRIILTRDKDFLILTQYPKYKVPTIVIRLRIQEPNYIKERLIQLLKNQDENILSKSLTIIREDSADSYPY